MVDRVLLQPYDLIRVYHVQQTLKFDKGVRAKLTSFKIVEFNRNDNNATCIITVKVKYEKDGNSGDVSYVAKLNISPPDSTGAMISKLFSAETNFYRRILPLLNNELFKANDAPLRVPNHYFSVVNKGKEAIYLQDLRSFGYKTFDKMRTLDKAHTNLVLRELARLHASSSILFRKPKYSRDYLANHFPLLFRDFDITISKEISDLYLIVNPFNNVASLTDQIAGYEYVSEYVKSLVPRIKEATDPLLTCTKPFVMIRHGDYWTDNFLFRYSPSGIPLECSLLDFQKVSVASPAIDMHHLLYPCLTSELRREEMTNFLTLYYATFASVLSGTQNSMPFTLAQLGKEFDDKLLFGFLLGTMLIQWALLKPEDLYKLEQYLATGDGVIGCIGNIRKIFNEVSLASPHLRPRLLDMFDELKELGFFNRPFILFEN